MRSAHVALVILSTCSGAGAAQAQYLERAASQGAIGETNSIYLTPPGAFINPYYNDVSGGTDKLLTASAKVGALWQSSEHSYELMLRWRFLTPAFESAFGRHRNAEPIGRYADWAELSQVYARPVEAFGERLKLQATVGANHVGNKGAKQVHTWIHEVTRNQVSDLEYTDQPTGNFINVGGFVAYLAPIARRGRVELGYAPGFGFDASKFMTETYLSFATVAVVRREVWEVASELRVIAQHGSAVYSGIRPFRYEASLGTLLMNCYKPTVKYVSTYLHGDPIGQTYFDFLNLQVPF